MMFSMLSCRRLTLALLACTIACGAYAQQTPITGQMGAPAASPTVANSATAPSVAADAPQTSTVGNASTRTEVGDTTRLLLGMQRQGTNAGKVLPIPGQEASASYQRYLKSFEHPIPEFYEAAVSKNAGSGSGMSNSSGTP